MTVNIIDHFKQFQELFHINRNSSLIEFEIILQINRILLHFDGRGVALTFLVSGVLFNLLYCFLLPSNKQTSGCCRTQ